MGDGAKRCWWEQIRDCRACSCIMGRARGSGETIPKLSIYFPFKEVGQVLNQYLISLITGFRGEKIPQKNKCRPVNPNTD